MNMAVKRTPNAWNARISLVGIDLVTVEARIVVASLATDLSYADGLAESDAQAPPPAWPGLARRTA